MVRSFGSPSLRNANLGNVHFGAAGRVKPLEMLELPSLNRLTDSGWERMVSKKDLLVKCDDKLLAKCDDNPSRFQHILNASIKQVKSNNFGQNTNGEEQALEFIMEKLKKKNGILFGDNFHFSSYARDFFSRNIDALENN